MSVNNAKLFVNNMRRITKRNWPTPVKYIGGGANGKVYLTNSGKLMKIGLGSNPQEFRPLSILGNTKFVPKFNKKNWSILPIAKRSYGKLKFLNSAKKLFPKKLGNNANVERAYTRSVYREALKNKKATIFLMNKVGNKGNIVMTLHNFATGKNAIQKQAIRNVVKEMVKKIHQKGISHGNLHSGNILVSISSNGSVKLWMIDFGRSTVIPLGNTERNAYMKKFKFKSSGLFNSRGVLSRLGYNNVQVFYNKNYIPKRLNAHMLKVHYGVNNYPRNLRRGI